MKTATVKKQVQQPLINMKYGAPELLSLYQKYAFRGLMYAIVFSLLVIGSIAGYNSLHATDNDETQYDRKIIDVLQVDIPVKQEAVETLPPVDVPQAEQTVKLKDLAALIPQPVAKQESEVLTTKTQQALDNVSNTNVGKEGTDNPNEVTAGIDEKTNGKIEENIIKEEPPKPVKETFNSFEVEKAPVAVNLSSIKSSIKYPEIAVASNVEGTCVAKILVGTDGEILKVVSISGPDIFRGEIENKIFDLQFTPALQNGKPVKCYVNVPFKFSLKK